MENILDKIARGLLRPINTSAVIILALYSILWGLWVINPFWTVFDGAEIYSLLYDLGGEVFWGAAAIIGGCVTAYGVIKPSYLTLTRGAYVMFFLWLTISILYFLGNWMGTGGITAGTFAFYAGFIWLNLKVNKTRFGWDDKRATEALRLTRRDKY